MSINIYIYTQYTHLYIHIYIHIWYTYIYICVCVCSKPLTNWNAHPSLEFPKNLTSRMGRWLKCLHTIYFKLFMYIQYILYIPHLKFPLGWWKCTDWGALPRIRGQLQLMGGFTVIFRLYPSITSNLPPIWFPASRAICSSGERGPIKVFVAFCAHENRRWMFHIII